MITFKDIDAILIPWAKKHDLHIYTKHKDEEVRTMIFIDQWGDEYHLYAIPDFENSNREIVVGADLSNRADKKHTFYRERKSCHFRKPVALDVLASALNEAWNVIQEWGVKNHKNSKSGA